MVRGLKIPPENTEMIQVEDKLKPQHQDSKGYGIVPEQCLGCNQSRGWGLLVWGPCLTPTPLVGSITSILKGGREPQTEG